MKWMVAVFLSTATAQTSGWVRVDGQFMDVRQLEVAYAFCQAEVQTQDTFRGVITDLTQSQRDTLLKDCMARFGYIAR